MTAGNNQYVERPTAQGREGKTETGEATEVLAEIERQVATLKQGTEIPVSAQGREREKTGKATEVLEGRPAQVLQLF